MEILVDKNMQLIIQYQLIYVQYLVILINLNIRNPLITTDN